MFLAHSFRLRDPWQCEPLDGGALRWSRGFHRPTGLEPDDALWLVISGLPPNAAVTLNGQSLAPPPGRPNEFEATPHLADANRLEILIPSDLQPPASSLQPRSFPYDVRLGVMAES